MSQSKMIIEWAPFELADGVDEEKLLTVSDDFQQAFVNEQKGFIRRELLKGSDGQWVDLVFWQSKEDAEQVLKNAENSPACHAFFQLMKLSGNDDPGAGVLHFQHVKTYQ